MPVFRVHGQNLQGQSVFVDIDCVSDAVARNTALGHGLVNTRAVEVVDGAASGDVVHPAPVRTKRALPIPLAWQSILTIAAGVFLGLFAWTVCSFVFAAIMGVLAR